MNEGKGFEMHKCKFNVNKIVCPNKKNYMIENPINSKDVKRKKVNGEYVYEKFYLIDFLDIKENSYVISSFGRIFSLIKNKEMKPITNASRNNYKTIMLSTKDSKSKKYSLSRLVARAFVLKSPTDNKLNRKYVHHKNWDNDYNYYWNLEWRTNYEIRIMSRIQKMKDIDEDKIVKFVCILLEKGNSINDIYEIVYRLISKDKITKIKNRIICNYISYKYKF